MLTRILSLAPLFAGASLCGVVEQAQAGPPGYYGYTGADNLMYYHAHGAPWHGQYRHTAFGKPVALVVPPIANRQTHYHWGVTGTTMTPIYHQFGRSYPGEYTTGDDTLRNTPYWPSSTDQFGVYSVRGPW